jgi:hypothetical protein
MAVSGLAPRTFRQTCARWPGSRRRGTPHRAAERVAPRGQRRLITAPVPHFSYCHFPQLVIEGKLPVNPDFAGFVGPIV